MGPYLCYRVYLDDKIRIRKILGPDATPNEEHWIDLTNILQDHKGNEGCITFARVPKLSFQTIRSDNKQGEGLTCYNNLLEVVFRNSSYIFDLDTMKPSQFQTPKTRMCQGANIDDAVRLYPKEVNFIEGTCQLAQLDTFINTGTTH